MSKKGNVINFEDLVNVSGSMPKGSDVKKPAVNDMKSETIVRYWAERESGKVYDKLIKMFEEKFDGTVISLLNALNYMNLYLAENKGGIMDSEDDIVFGEDAFEYADFYEWFSSTFLGEEETCQITFFNYNGDLPPILSFGSYILNEMKAVKNTYDYGSGALDEDYKKSADRILEYIASYSSEMCMAMCFDKEGEPFLADQVVFFKDIPADIKEHMEMILKSNIMQLYRNKGEILLLYMKEGKLYMNGFYTGDAGFEVMDEDALEDMRQYCLDSFGNDERMEEFLKACQIANREKAKL